MANVRDFYMRGPEDPKYIESRIEVYDEVEAMINQIRMNLLTNTGEVLGSPKFGLNIEKYLFEFEVDPFSLAADAQEQLTQYVTLGKNRELTVEPFRYQNPNSNSDSMVLSVNLGPNKRISILYE